MMSQQFLSDLATGAIEWSITSQANAVKSIHPGAVFFGQGSYRLEVATATSESRPTRNSLETLWKARRNYRANPVILVVFYDTDGSERAALAGPSGEEPAIIEDVSPAQADRLCRTLLGASDRFAAERLARRGLQELETAIPGLRNAGMFSTYELKTRVPERPDWQSSVERGNSLLKARGSDLIHKLGFTLEQGAGAAQILRAGDTKTAVALFLSEAQTFDTSNASLSGSTPVSYGLSIARREGLKWLLLLRDGQLRIHSTADIGVGRQGQAETFVELDLNMLSEDDAGYLPLLAAGTALQSGGTFEQILNESYDYAIGLGERLRERIYDRAVPLLATSLAKQEGGGSVSEDQLDHVYEQAMLVLFRLLFVAYAEDKDFLPSRTNGRYQRRALKTMARELADARRDGALEFDDHSTDRWQDALALFAAIRNGNAEWGVSAYDGSLFSDDPNVNTAGAAVSQRELKNAEFGPVLEALLVDEGPDGLIGPVDFRSLSVREFGTIYEGLLESQLSIAPEDLTLDSEGRYVPQKGKARVIVPKGRAYFHSRSGERKSTGSYFTKPFAVEHLLDKALEPALDSHLERIRSYYDAGDMHSAAQSFFDFRVADIAMGSGHFLVAAVDRIEARLATFLAEHPIHEVQEELDTLARRAQGDGQLDTHHVDPSSLLRRMVARRCIYGVDRNRIAVELARLGIWLHTFVPGLPLSFLDHNLVEGDSLTGIATMDEAVSIIDTGTADKEQSIFADQIDEFLSRARSYLGHLGSLVDETTDQIAEARQAQQQIARAIEPARQLFDLLIAHRLGKAQAPNVDENQIASHPDLSKAQRMSSDLKSLHFPIAFPEVFMRERPGFDCIVGNPPWEEATVEELGFWTLRFPGLKSLSTKDRQKQIAKLEKERPDLKTEYESELPWAARLRELLHKGPFPGMGTGDPDVYKAFVWRFWALVNKIGRIGVVLPRSAMSASGTAEWRKAVIRDAGFEDVTFLLNRGGWAFDDAEHRYTMALVALAAGDTKTKNMRFRGPFTSLNHYRQGMQRAPLEVNTSDFLSWTTTASFPLLPSQEGAEVFMKLRAHPRLDTDEDEWMVRPHRELDASLDKKHINFNVRSTDGLWPVGGGKSFDIWEPDTGTYYGWAKPKYIQSVLQEKRVRAHRNKRSALYLMPTEWVEDPETLPCLHPRIAFRDVSRATDTRTVRVALVPSKRILNNSAPYFLWQRGNAADVAYLLGVMSSLPFDWYARRYVENHLNFFVLSGFPAPRPGQDDPLRREIVKLAGRLAAVDDRYAQWAEEVGVPVGSVKTMEEKERLVARLDAAVALLYGLEERDVDIIFETFHEGWDYVGRLQQVKKHMQDLKGTVQAERES